MTNGVWYGVKGEDRKKGKREGRWRGGSRAGNILTYVEALNDDFVLVFISLSLSLKSF